MVKRIGEIACKWWDTQVENGMLKDWAGWGVTEEYELQGKEERKHQYKECGKMHWIFVLKVTIKCWKSEYYSSDDIMLYDGFSCKDGLVIGLACQVVWSKLSIKEKPLLAIDFPGRICSLRLTCANCMTECEGLYVCSCHSVCLTVTFSTRVGVLDLLRLLTSLLLCYLHVDASKLQYTFLLYCTAALTFAKD